MEAEFGTEFAEFDVQVGALRAWARDNLSFEQAIHMFALHKAVADELSAMLEEANDDHNQSLKLIASQSKRALASVAMLKDAAETFASVPTMLGKAMAMGLHVAKVKASKRAKAAADVLHDKPGGNRNKQSAIRLAWASGNYTSRDICAEQECAALDMSFSTARKALRNTPEPT